MKKRIFLISLIVMMFLSLTGCKSKDYKDAVAYQEAKDYVSAVTLYEELGEYKDSTERLTECKAMIKYDTAKAEQEAKNYASAAAIYEELGEYKDSTKHLAECKAMIDAIKKYDTAKELAAEKNAELETSVSDAEGLISEKKKALDDTLIPSLETAISEAKAAEYDVPTIPETADDIMSVTEELNAIDYSDVISNLSDKKGILEKSIKQYELVDAPAEAYIIDCLSKVPNIVDISAVTEDNDPNGNLNKAGGYTAQVYFSSDLIDQSSVWGSSVIEKGTDCGGSIEVYATVEEAELRNDYLATFDGTPYASGSHTVIGTVIVRTSDELTATQQKEMEASIIAMLTAFES